MKSVKRVIVAMYIAAYLMFATFAHHSYTTKVLPQIVPGYMEYITMALLLAFAIASVIWFMCLNLTLLICTISAEIDGFIAYSEARREKGGSDERKS